MPRLTEKSPSNLFIDGAKAFIDLSATLDDEDWNMPACGTWSAAQLARHVLAAADWYHVWLDRAVQGDASPPFSMAAVAEHNETALREPLHLTGLAAAGSFEVRAGDYAERVSEHWELPYGYPFGTVTAGLHVGVAAAEWHLHSWDLARSVGRHHKPSNPRALFTTAGICVARAEGGLRGRLLERLVPVGARYKPWATVLKQSGRRPDPTD